MQESVVVRAEREISTERAESDQYRTSSKSVCLMVQAGKFELCNCAEVIAEVIDLMHPLHYSGSYACLAGF